MKRHLITSAIPYINGVKHLGNLVGSQLPADLFARYQRAKGNEVLFLCATDEHGTPAELAAEKAGKYLEHSDHAILDINPDDYVNPLVHVLMLTAIVVGVATLGVGLAITQKLYGEFGTVEESEIIEAIKSEK